jgi:hypothetical protein
MQNSLGKVTTIPRRRHWRVSSFLTIAAIALTVLFGSGRDMAFALSTQVFFTAFEEL